MNPRRVFLLTAVATIVLVVAIPFALYAQRQTHIRESKLACEQLREQLLAYEEDHGSYPG